MNCREAEHSLFAERDGALDETQRAALVSHVDECSACRLLRQNLTVALAELQASSRQSSLPDVELEWQKLRREIRGGATAQMAASRRSPITWFALPLAAAAALAIAFFVTPGTQKSDFSATPTAKIAQATSASESEPASTMVFVDDKSGWTFVWASAENTQRI
jgi:anti-sigma factor RsiW